MRELTFFTTNQTKLAHARYIAEGRQIRIKDIGFVVLGARNEDATSKVDGKPNASLAVWALPDANSIATAQRVRDRMEQLKKEFPQDLDYTISLDMTPFIQESIDEVVRTLADRDESPGDTRFGAARRSIAQEKGF